MERLGLSSKLQHALERAGIRTFDQLKNLPPRKLAHLPGVGSVNLAVLKSALQPYELERIGDLQRQIHDHRQAIKTLEVEINRVRGGNVDRVKPHDAAVT